ncbi:hypothetical protein B0T16DRAFT_457665 [Cercophora newfieldiana]|uniref:HTH APSES-type domain-containing protein n=1 Tax=Cercophora newfieldiana TaxID=92897 RepID=A0AA39Y5Y4_9PEZI|nr:hypothetical protein B0T16DRAFT_457665 [Cercophora newfieldiana]
MVSVASLLNPDPPRAPIPETRQALGSPVLLTISSPTDEAVQTTEATDIAEMARDHQMPGRSRSKGAVNFPPFEDVDEHSVREVRRFQVHSFGSIRGTCRRIPYNSGKKEFTQKTGRESFEVFQYEFKLPGEEGIHIVMWDYHIGLVRMTPFFKCCKYSKTTPAKMLGLNPGLKEITHSITGGSIKAQGYWMPYHCAKAVCATFCHHIAGALIPLFGPDFPSLCVPRDSPRYGHMVIDPAITEASAREARRFLHLHSPYGTPLTPRRTGSISPRQIQHLPHSFEHHIRDNADEPHFQRADALHHNIPRVSSNMEVDEYTQRPRYISRGPATEVGSASEALAIPRSAGTYSPGWAAVNRPNRDYVPPPRSHDYYGGNLPSGAGRTQDVPSPFLSAVPTRHAARQHPYSRYQAPTSFVLAEHRRNVPTSSGGGYDSRRSPAMSASTIVPSGSIDTEPDHRSVLPSPAATFASQDSHHEAEKDAAMMLMNLCGPVHSQHAAESPSRDGRSPSAQCAADRNYTPSSASEGNSIITSKPSSPSLITARSALPSSREGRPKKRRATLT